jgi:hypothetical protein
VEVTKQICYQNKWLTDETYFRAIKAQFTTLGDSFNRAKMNRAISVWGGNQLDDFSESNQSGKFRRKACGVDPFGSIQRNIWAYYVTTPGQLVKRPRDGKSRNFLSLLQDSSINDRYSVARGVTKQNRYWDKWLTNETYLSAKELRVFVGSLHLVYDVLELAYLFTQNQHNVLLMQGIS